MNKTYFLICENDLNMLHLMERTVWETLRTLHKENVKIKCFQNPFELLGFAKNNYCPVVFTGVELCGIDGFNLTKQLNTLYKDTNVIFVTAYEEYILQALQMHLRISGYLIKPPTVEGVIDQLENILYPIKEQIREKKAIGV